MDVEGFFPNEPKNKIFVFLSANMSTMIFLFSCYTQVVQAASTSLEVVLDFDHLHEFQLHLEKGCEGFRRDQMQRI